VLASDSRFKNLGLALPVTRREQNCSGDNLPECLSLGWRYPIQIMALHHPQRGALPELRSRPEMRIVHCREGVPHCILSPAPQVERLFRLALRVSLPPDVERFGASYLPNKFTGSRGNYNCYNEKFGVLSLENCGRKRQRPRMGRRFKLNPKYSKLRSLCRSSGSLWGVTSTGTKSGTGRLASRISSLNFWSFQPRQLEEVLSELKGGTQNRYIKLPKTSHRITGNTFSPKIAAKIKKTIAGQNIVCHLLKVYRLS